MPEGLLPLRWRQAALALERRLRQLTGQAPERLDAQAVASCYPKRSWVAGWRITVSFSDGIARRIDVLATSAFPLIPVRTALVDHPDFLTWPHVESDGVLCLLPNMAEADPDDPSGVAENLVIRSCRLIEELLQGDIVERDFREEFLTYWAYKVHADGSRLFSLLAPKPPSRMVRVWRGKGIDVVGEDAASLVQWVRMRYGDDVKASTEAAAFLFLETPPLPTAYPELASDLRAMAVSIGEDAVAALEGAISKEPEEVLAILGAVGRGGPGLIAVKVINPKRLRSRPRAITEPVSKAFRPGRTPQPLLVNRYFGASPVIRSSVSRADAAWVHGRGQDVRTARLLRATVVLFGCGSVGAPVACALALAGVGRMVLVDPDRLSWPNVGRHPLGATAVDRNKAEALADRLQSDFPHLRIEGRPHELHNLLRFDAALLEQADLIISTTGSWAAENALNRWHLTRGGAHPVLYGWTEAHGCAGHAVAIAAAGGCLQCHIGRTGVPTFKVVTWPDGDDTNQEEPACGAHFQPYGPIELSYITAMISDMALDCLLDPPSESVHRIFAASPRRIEGLGGRLSNQWLGDHGRGDEGVRTVDRDWPRIGCIACAAETLNEAA